MPLSQTLQKVEDDIQQGDLGKAVGRLHGLIATYPDDLALREKLGSLYWRLQMPGMAGRYWYLVENKDENMQRACQGFEEAFGHDPVRILFAIKFKGDTAAIQDTYAGRVLAELARSARKKHPWYDRFRARASARNPHPAPKSLPNKARDFFIMLGCIVATVLLLLLILVGLITAVEAILRWSG